MGYVESRFLQRHWEMSETARPYQSDSISQIRNEFLSGNKKVLLWLATGAGKTWIFSKMIKESSERGKKSLIVVRGRKLVDQASQRLFREGVPHGVLMSSHWNRRAHERVQVCSIDTMIARNLRPEADLIVIDEAHLASSEGYKQFLSKYPEAFIVACTATPYVDKGLRHVADSIIHPITMDELIEQGYLCPFRYFAPSAPDMTGVKISSSTNDYVAEQAYESMIKGKLTGDIIDHWQKIANGPPTLCFAVNIRHSKILAEKFNSAGIPAEHCDADVPDKERNEIIKRLERGITKVITNVGIFCTGVDIPPLGAIILARPTQSLNLYIQQCGRGTRLFSGKQNCILLDHAGNIERHGLPTDEPEVNLDGTKGETHKKESKTCKECFAVYRGPICPECGITPRVEERMVDLAEAPGELKEIDPKIIKGAFRNSPFKAKTRQGFRGSR